MLSGPVDVCVAVPRLAVDRAFTYLLSPEQEAGTGSLVSVPFHGRTLKGWVLGPAISAPDARLMPVRSVRSAVRFFDPEMLELLRWVSERYIAPLATVIERSHPPRVAAEERPGEGMSIADRVPGPFGPTQRQPSTHAAGSPASQGCGWEVSSGTAPDPGKLLPRYRAEGLLTPGRVSWLRPLPRDEVDACVESVQACLAGGRRALVLVGEAEPLPATAAALLEQFGDAAVAYLGGKARQRYRKWLDIQSGRYAVVVGTRPAVFAPLSELGLLWISREVHPGHRENRSPYYHVREVATARAGIQGPACVLASLSPSLETAVAASIGAISTCRPARADERSQAPLVECAPIEAEDRSVRLEKLLKKARSAALILSRRGYGIARVCRSCRAPAACSRCGGAIVIAGGVATCRGCGAPGRCSRCGSISFAVERGGTERLAEWAARLATVPVELERGAGPPPVPGPGRVVIGTAAEVKDVGPRSLGLVAILDPDRALSRAGIHAGEQALATWMEAAAWAAPRAEGGRVLLQTRRPGHPALQALIRWEPLPFLLQEGARRQEAGFPPGHPVFRLEGTQELPRALQAARPLIGQALATSVDGRTVCLVTVRPAQLPGFRREILRLAAEGVVSRLEAEPHP